MGFEPKISKLARSLTGFNGATSITVGTIDLDVHSPPGSARKPSWSSTRFPLTTKSWADCGSARSRPSHLLYIRRSAIPSLRAGSGRSTVTKSWQGDAQPKGSRRASNCSSHQ
ncbi:unnamed protein product [Prunus armeniaca]